MAPAWPDHDRVERHRLFEAGAIIYCPVCRRPGSAEPIGPVEGIRRLVRHLSESHDELYIGLLRANLAPPRETPDPFYPEGSGW